MFLSDYEIKEITHQFIKKSKKKKLESFDYYRMGLINFYKGSYGNAYSNFKIAHKLVSSINTQEIINSPSKSHISINTVVNISKWLAFAGLIILFSGNKIDFTNLKNFNLNQDFNNSAMNKDNDNSEKVFFVSCCAPRKNNKISQLIQNDKDQENFYLNNLHNDSLINKIDNFLLSYEIEELIQKILENEQNSLEGWWMQMYISIYCQFNKNQKLFKISKKIEPKYCIQKIKKIDQYLSYIAYAEMNFILSENLNYPIDEILSELIIKYKNKCEAYLKLWQLCVKKNSKFKNDKKANLLSEYFWKISSQLKYDESDRSQYYLYILITYAKSQYLIGNSNFTISLFQKEYISNFLYPSIFYLVKYFNF